MTSPNFFIIGAPKCGTTSLYHYLKVHPQIFMSSLKESYFFSSDKHEDPTLLAEFEALFKDATDEKAIGEACASYIFNEAYRRIGKVAPGAKLIAILRDPAERAYSEFLMDYRTGYIKEEISEEDMESSFLKFLEQEGSSKFYHESICNYLEHFERDQIKILLFEDLKKNPQKIIRESFEFLGVNSEFEVEIGNKVYNKGGLPKNAKIFLALETMRQNYRKRLAQSMPAWLYATMRSAYAKLRSMNMQSKSIKLSAAGRQKVIDIHREDTLKLQDLLGRDLSAWLT